MFTPTELGVVELCENFKGEGAGMTSSHFLRTKRIRLTFSIKKIRNPPHNQRLHRLVPMSGPEKAATSHLYGQGTIIFCTKKSKHIRATRSDLLFSSGNRSNKSASRS